MRMLPLCLALLMAAGLLVIAVERAPAAEVSYAPRVGQPYPDFTLARIDNRQPMSLSQLRGKKVLLIHFASW